MKSRREVPTCFHCGESGNIPPMCNKLEDALKSREIIGYMQKTIRRRINCKNVVMKKMWIRKDD